MTGLPPEFTLSRSPERSEGETKGRLAPTNVTLSSYLPCAPISLGGFLSLDFAVRAPRVVLTVLSFSARIPRISVVNLLLLRKHKWPGRYAQAQDLVLVACYAAVPDGLG